MENLMNVSDSMTSTIILAFVSVVLLVSTVVCIMLLKDNRNKQELYKRFAGNLNEFVVVLSQKMEFLYGLPIFMSDALFTQLSAGRTFSEILGSNSWNRMKTYFDEVDKHQNMPFIFSVMLDSYSASGPENGSAWYEMRVSVEKVNTEEFYYICFLKNISKENENRCEKEHLQERLDSLLQNTGDFLWSFDVEDRSMKLLTPMMDDQHRVIPQSVGLVDVHRMMPDRDYALLDKVLNDRIKAYKNFGFRGDTFETIKVRFYGPEKTLVWYGLRGKLVYDENNRLVFQGSARRMDYILEDVFSGVGQEGYFLIKAALSLPDIRAFWLDRNFKVLGCNQSFATDFQIIDPRETFGKNLDHVVSREFLPYISMNLSAVFDGGRNVSWKGAFGLSKQSGMLMFNAVPLEKENNMVNKVLCVYLLLDKNEFDDSI